MSTAVILGRPDPGRPLRRWARGHAAGRSRCARDPGGRRPRRCPARADRGRVARLCEPGGRGQPQRRAHGAAARGPARVRGRRDRQPALRLRARGRRRRVPRGDRRRRRSLRRRRRRIDVARTARDGEARRRVPARRPDALRHDARLAVPEPAAGGAVPAGDDGRDGRERRRALDGVASGSGRVRAALAAALGCRGRGRPVRRRARRGRRRDARRASAPRHLGGEARLPASRVSPGRHRDRRQLVGAERRRGRARDRVRGEGARARGRAARPLPRVGGRRCRPARDGHRAGAGGAAGCSSARGSPSRMSTCWS